MPNSTGGAGGFTAASVSAIRHRRRHRLGRFQWRRRARPGRRHSSTLAIELNNGSGGFTAGDSYSIPSGYEAKGVAVGNFTGHGDSVLDIAVLLASTSTGAYSVAVYTGNGDGSFDTPVITSVDYGAASGPRPDSIVAADFNNDGKTDLAFTTDDGQLDVMLAATGGSMSSATSLTLPSGHLAIGVTAVDYNGDGDNDLVAEVQNPDFEGDYPFVALDLLTGDGSGDFCVRLRPTRRSGRPITTHLAWSTGDFQGSSMGLEVAVPITNGGGGNSYVDIVPLSSSGTWGYGVTHYVGPYDGPYSASSVTSDQAGNILAADLNGAGTPSIALVNSGTGQIQVMLADLASNQFLPTETIVAASDSAIGMLAIAPFMGTAAMEITAARPATRQRLSRTKTVPGRELIPMAPLSSSTRRARKPQSPTATATRSLTPT